jgi:hypothetical protein
MELHNSQVQITSQTTYAQLLQIFSNNWNVFSPSNEQVITTWKAGIQNQPQSSPVGKIYCKGVVKTNTGKVSPTFIKCTSPGNFSSNSLSFFPNAPLTSSIADNIQDQVQLLNNL